MTKEIITSERQIQKQPDEITPKDVVVNATTQAKLLMDIVEKTECYQEISGKKYLQVEAWETIGAFNRVNARTEKTDPIIENDEIVGYCAHVQLWKDGQIVGGAVMPCFFSEYCCQGKEGDAKHKAAMSAAQTFATSKAYRMNYSYIATLAGYEPTPAEEITTGTVPSEHWCSIHDVPFKKKQKGKSTWWAHKTEDGEWCNEAKVEKQVQKQAKQKTEQSAGTANVEKPKEGLMPRPVRDPATIKSISDLLKACYEDFRMQPKTVLNELNVNFQSEITESPTDCYIKIRAIRCG